ncbi:MAG: hypothetical protein AMS21_04755 [Gemmatimonas sp. SG8_38_2]|nr:MAG: hypothetical protein AMS21_04755 [Gemmatimonas sp. SG8_38_2]
MEIHFAFWTVLSVPLGFAGTFFLFPGLVLEWGVALLGLSGLLVFYVSKLTRGTRAAWLLGLIGHGLLLVAAVYYVPRWPALLGFPLALANLYSLIVLVVYRRLWSELADSALQEALA